jgi:CO dehydrogenase maturation factor
MGLFHCPIGAAYYEDRVCIGCGLCNARTREEAVDAAKKIRDYLRKHGSLRQSKYRIRKIAVCGKGGVGKSTIVTLLARTLREYGYNVLVVDTDESNPGLYRQLGFERQPLSLLSIVSRFTPDENEIEINGEWLTRDEIRTEDIPAEFLLGENGLRFMMVGKIEDPFQGCACSMADVMRDFTLKLSLQDREILLIDHEAGVESFGRGVERGVDTVLTIVEPSFESLALAEKIQYMAEGIGIGRIRVILNKIPSEQIEKQIIASLRKRKTRYLGAVHVDEVVSIAGFEGKPLGDSRAKTEIETITRLMLDEAEMKYARQGGMDIWKPD